MQQRQLRLGDILDDYCPRERRVTNHAVVAMLGSDVKQTRCTTCDAEHEYKHAKVPRQRRKSETPAALYAQVAASGPKRVAHEAAPAGEATDATEAVVAAAVPHEESVEEQVEPFVEPAPAAPAYERSAAAEAPPDTHPELDADGDEHDDDREGERDAEDGPIHRRLIRASLPRPEGQQPPARPIPEFTIRQPGGRPNRFRPRHQRGAGGGTGGGHQFGGGNRSNGNVHGGPPRGMRPGGGRPPQGALAGRRHGPGGGGRKRSK
jgi:hypothetical protein